MNALTRWRHHKRNLALWNLWAKVRREIQPIVDARGAAWDSVGNRVTGLLENADFMATPETCARYAYVYHVQTGEQKDSSLEDNCPIMVIGEALAARDAASTP